MSRQYSPNTFLRQTPNVLLKEYFDRKEVLSQVAWNELAETDIESIGTALGKLPNSEHVKVEQEFREINELACVRGTSVLLEEAQSRFHGLELAEAFGAMKSHYERSLWMFLNHPKIFTIASNLAYMDNLGSWRSRHVGANFVPAIEKGDLENLAEGISEFYKKQGRGNRCHVDNYLREDPKRHCYFAYPEDYATTDIGYDDKGQFLHRPRRPAFEIIFVYRPDTGIVELSAKGKKQDIEQLQNVFCQTILGLLGLPNENTKYFDLSPLKNKDISFPTNPQDGIENVSLNMLRLDLPGPGGRRIILEASTSQHGRTVRELMHSVLNQKNLSLDTVKIAKAKFQIKFVPQDGKKGKSVTFEISVPDSCSLKDDPLHQIAKKYIEKWGLFSG